MNNVTTSSQRRNREKALLRDRILDAARALFAQHGYDAVTMRQVAARIHYTASALYYHFPDKQSLVMALCDQDFMALVHFLKGIGRIVDPIERIRRMGAAYVRFGLEHPHHYRFMFMTTLPDTNRPGSGLERGNPDVDPYAFLLQAVKEAHGASRFRAGFADPEAIAQAVWAAVHGVVSLHLTRGADTWIEWRTPENTVALQTDALLHGLLRRASP